MDKLGEIACQKLKGIVNYILREEVINMGTKLGAWIILYPSRKGDKLSVGV